METVKRELSEQQEYELLMQQLKDKIYAEGGTAKDTERLNDNFLSRNTPRKAKKFVFFKVTTGELVFEYGGIQTPFVTKNCNDKEVKIYELGCLVKEIREEDFNP